MNLSLFWQKYLIEKDKAKTCLHKKIFYNRSPNSTAFCALQ